MLTPTPAHDPNLTPAESLVAYRQEIGMTQSEAATLLDRKLRQYQRWEAGVTPVPQDRLDWMARRVAVLRHARSVFRQIIEEADRVDPPPGRESLPDDP